MRHELGILLRGAPEDLRNWINDPGMKGPTIVPCYYHFSFWNLRHDAGILERSQDGDLRWN